MPSTHNSLQYHIVFSTRDRYPHIARDWRDDLHSYLGGCVRALGAVSLRVGGVADHVHLLVGTKPTHAPADVVREIKKASTAWVREKFDRKFSWQEGYGAFTVSRSLIDAVARYIDNQEEHHKKRSFQDEYIAFLQELEIEFDSNYLW